MIVQHASGVMSSTVPGAITIPAAPTAGNLLLVFIFTNIGTGSITVNSGSWTLAQAATNGGSTYGHFLYRYVQLGDTATLPALWTGGSTYWAYSVYEISGVTGTFGTDVPVLSTPVATGFGTNSNTANNATSTANNQTSIVASGLYNGAENGSISQGYVLDEVQDNNGNFGSVICGHRFLPTLGTTVNPTTFYINTNGPSALFSVIAEFAPSASAIEVMQNAHGGQTGTAASAAATFGIATTTGRSIVALVNSGDKTCTGVADDTGATNTYVQVGTTYVAFGTTTMSVWLCANAAAANTITATMSASGLKFTVEIYEVDVTGGHLAFDAENHASGSSGTAVSSGTVTISGSDEIIFAHGMAPLGGPVFSSGAGYTIYNHGSIDDNSNTLFGEFKNVTASEAATATLNSSATWVINAAAFKVAAAASTETGTTGLDFSGIELVGAGGLEESSSAVLDFDGIDLNAVDVHNESAAGSLDFGGVELDASGTAVVRPSTLRQFSTR